MAAAFDDFPEASFNGLVFPYSDLKIPGGLRDHVHTYPHAAGGDPEKMGREVYTWTFTCPFHDTFRAYPDLYPGQLTQLLGYFEQGETHALVIPNRGTKQAYCRNWTSTLSARARSGETLELVFVEDMAGDFTAQAILLVQQRDLGALATNLSALGDDLVPKPGLFDSIDALANDIASIKGSIEIASSTIAGKLASLDNLCQQLDGLTELQGAATAPIVDALHDLRDAASQLAADVQSKSRQLISFVVPRTMSINDIAKQLYGAADQASDILALNVAIDDAFAVPAGLTLKVYSP